MSVSLASIKPLTSFIFDPDQRQECGFHQQRHGYVNSLHYGVRGHTTFQRRPFFESHNSDSRIRQFMDDGFISHCHRTQQIKHLEKELEGDFLLFFLKRQKHAYDELSNQCRMWCQRLRSSVNDSGASIVSHIFTAMGLYQCLMFLKTDIFRFTEVATKSAMTA